MSPISTEQPAPAPAGTRRRAGLIAIGLSLALALSATVLARAPAASTGPELSAAVSPGELTYGNSLTVTGRVLAAGVGAQDAPLALQAEPYPYRGFVAIAHASSAADGSFAFSGVKPDRNTRLRVIDEASPGAISPVLGVLVDPRAAINAVSLGRGRTRLSLRVEHTREGESASVSASWFVAAAGTRTFHLAAVTPTREISAGVTYASATVDPPSRRFSYRVCFNPTWEPAMGAPPSHGRCVSTARTFRYQAEGLGIPVAAYPSPDAISAATRFLDARAGRTSFAVVDSAGRLYGARLHEHFQTASVVKVMMLVAYLQMLEAQHRDLRAADTSLLYPMIHISDNSAASAVLAIVGQRALARVARESGMSDYAPAIGWWAYTQTSAADQARFFLALEQLIPPRFYGYARGLLSGIEPSQSWGIPPVARPRWQVFFKTGALPSEGLFNEVARLERPGVTFTIAVFTSGDPSMSYGQQTIQGVAGALLAHAP
jgi:Beta-lactamase enzyme family